MKKVGAVGALKKCIKGVKELSMSKSAAFATPRGVLCVIKDATTVSFLCVIVDLTNIYIFVFISPLLKMLGKLVEINIKYV